MQQNMMHQQYKLLLLLIPLSLVIVFVTHVATMYYAFKDKEMVASSSSSEAIVATKPETVTSSHQEPSTTTFGSVNINGMHQEDPALIEEIKKKYLIQPSRKNIPYALTDPLKENPSEGQTTAILQILNNMSNGFFIECGALNGESLSNTLYLERFRGWSGLLVEADPHNVPEVLKRQRKAWVAPVCLSLSSTAQMARFKPILLPHPYEKGRGKLMDNNQTEVPEQVYVQCVPIFSLLLALNVSTVDYFSLDVEGAELSVLKFIPFDKINIRSLSVEYTLVKEGAKAVEEFMATKGYKLDMRGFKPTNVAEDYIFSKINP